jgi:hypothetical protein
MRHIARIITLGTLVACAACESARLGAPFPEIPATAVDESFSETGVRRVLHAYYSGFNERARLVIRDDQTWRDAWTRAYIGMSPAPNVPTIDFSKSAVILAARGSMGTGGYDITIARVARDGRVLYVGVTSTSPGDRCLTTQALTQPIDIVVVPHTVDQAVFVEHEAIHQC